VELCEFGVGGGRRPARGELFAFAEFFHLPDAEEQLVVAGFFAERAGENVVEAFARGGDELAEIVGGPLGIEMTGWVGAPSGGVSTPTAAMAA